MDCLESIKWKNIPMYCQVAISGYDMKYGKQLREIIMDDSYFVCDDERILDINNHPAMILFRYLYNSLERLSIRNTTLYSGNTAIPQDALIKFVRYASPKLNMIMFQLERPEIILLN